MVCRQDLDCCKRRMLDLTLGCQFECAVELSVDPAETILDNITILSHVDPNVWESTGQHLVSLCINNETSVIVFDNTIDLSFNRSL